MILRELLIAGVALISASCAAADTATVSSIPLSDVIHSPEKFNNKISAFEGFVIVGGYIPRFYPSQSSANQQTISEVIDLAPDSQSIDKQLGTYRAATCLVLEGKFRQYKGKFLGFGNFISHIGVIEVEHIAECRS